MPEETVKLLVPATEMRARAEEVLARAEAFQDEQARETMRGIAASYAKLAQRLEKEGRVQDLTAASFVYFVKVEVTAASAAEVR